MKGLMELSCMRKCKKYDSVIMLDNSSDEYPPVQLIIHVYVPYVDEVFKKTISAGCEIVEQPKERDGDPDRRTTFIDFADNI